MGCLATTATTVVAGIVAATTVVIAGVTVSATVVINQQQNDDDEQDPVAVTAAEQITQTHSFHPLTLTVYVGEWRWVRKTLACISGHDPAYILIRKGRGGALCIGSSGLRKKRTPP